MSKPLILYHGNCPDGFCSAWVAHRKFGDEADFLPVSYGQEPPDVAGRTLYILDFSYKRPVMRRILSQAHFVTVLDHHKTAEAELAGIVDEFTMRPDLIANPPGSELPVVHFDMNKSGARLTWEHLCTDPLSSWANCPVPWLVDYTEDRDLWRFSLPWSKEISAFIMSHPFDFRLWDDWSRTGPGSERWDTFVDQGSAILRYRDQLVRQAVNNAKEVELAGHRIRAVNSTVLFSEVAGELARGYPFGAAYFIRPDGKRVWSLRSNEDGVDVSEVAKQFGGGGHKHAAGFEELALA